MKSRTQNVQKVFDKTERRTMGKRFSLFLAFAVIVTLTACGNNHTDVPTIPQTADAVVYDTTTATQTYPDSDTSETTKPAEKTPERITESPAQPASTTKQADTVDGMRPEFKAAMDSYEKFMNEYVTFMKKYKANPSDLSILADYAEYMRKYADFVADFEKWETDEKMNAAETAHYIDVQARVSKKLLEVAG